MTHQGAYFDRAQSMASCADYKETKHVLETIAQRYIGAHPPHGPVYRVTRESGIRKLHNHLYDMPAGSLFPEMKQGQFVYAWAKLWADESNDFIFHLRCLGPVRLYHNGSKRFGSAPEEIIQSDKAASGETPPMKLKVKLERGWNSFVLELGKDEAGRSGAQFGTGSRKNKPFHFLAPSWEREGEEGWLYTAPLDRRLEDSQLRRLGAEQTEAATGLQWLPGLSPACEEGDMAKLYGADASSPGQEQFAFAWTTLVNESSGRIRVRLSGTAFGPVYCQWQGTETLAASEAGPLSIELELEPGGGDLVLRCASGQQGWGFGLSGVEAVHGTTGSVISGTSIRAPKRVAGMRGDWLYMGPFDSSDSKDATPYLSMHLVARSGVRSFYWTTGEPGAYVRPFLENELFGRWNYPLGVTMFGLLETSRLLGRDDIADYVARHVEFATSMYDYSLWDREKFGAAGLNNQLSDIDSLDDCGSFGALAMLAGQVRTLKGVRDVSDDIAHYIMNVQSRMDDGALYRHIGVSPSMHNTMWCDDMYMSVPFLCRYAEATGDSRYVDEAAKQLLLYKKYLYAPEKRIMSHVYDVSRGQPSGTFWGRGNGWVFFSLATLLGVLPQEHPQRLGILTFYRELAEGYRLLQGEHGLWHQVLTDRESYEEASCTSMFMYGFALGVQQGWLEEPELYAASAQAGWRGLCERAIDNRGNLYGVCKGSSWSYQHAYYKHDLGWNLNDTHGIGIALLAGIETCRMQQLHTKPATAGSSV